MCLAGLADVALSRNETITARSLAREALDILKEVGDRWFAAFSLDGLAMALAMDGQAELAARFFAAASAMRQAIGAALPEVRRPAHEHYLPAIQTQLGQPGFNRAWQEGQSLTLERIITLLGQAPAPAPAQDRPISPPAGLTQREIEVLGLVAQGLTDVQVAEKLVISHRTVHSHLTSIYNKLGINSRTAAVRYAVERGIV
jgi:DNA-binding CsgD family transcriptional regulator